MNDIIQHLGSFFDGIHMHACFKSAYIGVNEAKERINVY